MTSTLGTKTSYSRLKLIILVCISLVFRIGSLFYIGGDVDVFLISWVQSIRFYGVESYFEQMLTNYPYSYNFILYLISLITVDALGINILVRIVSYVADIGLAWIVAKIFQEEFKVDFKYAFIATYASVFVFINSSTGQCDSIWVSLGILSIYMLKHKRYAWSVFILGLSFGFKLQAICFVPVFLLYILLTKRLYLKYWIFGPLGWLTPQLPLMIFTGIPFKYLLSAYSGQADQCEKIAYNTYPTVFWILRLPYTYSLLIGVIGMGVSILLAWKFLTWERYEQYIYVVLGFFSLYTFIWIQGSLERYGFAMYVLSPLIYRYVQSKCIYWFPVVMSTVTLIFYLFNFGLVAVFYPILLIVSLIPMFKILFLANGRARKDTSMVKVNK